MGGAAQCWRRGRAGGAERGAGADAVLRGVGGGGRADGAGGEEGRVLTQCCAVLAIGIPCFLTGCTDCAKCLINTKTMCMCRRM